MVAHAHSPAAKLPLTVTRQTEVAVNVAACDPPGTEAVAV